MIAVGLLFFCSFGLVTVQSLSSLGELTAGDFRAAIQQAQRRCRLPFGILEKHVPHLPLGTDLRDVRYATLRAANQEYARGISIKYYSGQISKARHEPGHPRLRPAITTGTLAGKPPMR